MEIGITGLRGSGKSELFRLLTGVDAASRPGAASVGVARVPDERLDALSALYSPRKTTPATVRYVDLPGVPEEHRGEAALVLPEVRTMDVLMVVVRGFDNPEVPHPLETVDPLRDLARVEEELILSDQMVVERRLERLDRDLAKRRTPELAAERELLLRCLEVLEAGEPLRSVPFSETEKLRLRGFTFLSLKPQLVVLNIDESAVGSAPLAADVWTPWVTRPTTSATTVCATIEREIAELDPEDAREFMDELGIDRALDRLIRESYRLLGLASFFTVGEDECRAWSVREGTPAEEAAAVIHSDIQRGFIRAEAVRCEELLEAGSLPVCRQRGSLRLEGRTYPVRDGDVIHFRFAV